MTTTMSATEFNRRSPKILGDGWKTRLSRELKYSLAAIYRWSNDIHPVPANVAEKFDLWESGKLRIRTPRCKRGGWKPRRTATAIVTDMGNIVGGAARRSRSKTRGGSRKAQ